MAQPSTTDLLVLHAVRLRGFADTAAVAARFALDPDRAGVGGHPPVRRDLQHVAQAVPADRAAQGRVGAVHLVAGDPAGRHPGLHRSIDHGGGQRRLGRELGAGRDARLRTAVGVVGPRPGQVQGPVDQRVPTAAA